MEISYYILNAFSQSNKGGNPAGVVVLDEKKLSDNQMQIIANKINLTETAFVQKLNKTNFKVRFFTPETEVDLCGHATMAVFGCLTNIQKIGFGKYKQETKAGILNIEIRENNLIFMNQNTPKFGTIFEKKEVAKALNIKSEDILSEIPIQIVSTGFPTLLVPLSSQEILNSLSPSLKRCIELCQKKILLHPFTFETFRPESKALSRDFFPVNSLDEESATGTATGALACYLFQYNFLKKNQLQNLIFEQGYPMNRPSEIQASLKVKQNKIVEIKIGGFVSDMQVGKVEL